ncbi:RagB/SusD family nutrient uptake outer membrane protein [Compostibacter hankyongensis]|uniref:RagB/SusD family nutrient uptake outer membrane protein n=1 Tax=Compostibacter hankyongensis TaxID=1007089 RepID=A0ABP8FBY6_9BACT
MKTNYKPALSLMLVLTFALCSCRDFLKEEVYTEYDPESFLQTEEGINSVLTAAYSNMVVTSGLRDRQFTLNEFPGDIMWEWGGSFENQATLYMTFNWDPQENILSNVWQQYYVSIRNANSLLDNIDRATAISPEKVAGYRAEARFIRAADYYFLWLLFGPVPLVTTTDTMSLSPSRATEAEFNTFLTGELQAAATDLPLKQSLYGKATRGGALALLGEYYLNTAQWQQAADVSKQVMDLDQYKLFDGDLANMFAVANEENNEVIFTSPALPTLHGNNYMAHAFPPNYPIQSNWLNYGAQFCVYNDWVKTYAQNDKRRGWFLFGYTDVNGKAHDLLAPGDEGRAVRCFKYVPDPDAISENHGNDVPVIRYAEVLLNRAEALNELNGPNAESLDLLNEVRTRAGVAVYKLSDFSSGEGFRDALLKERGWEFVAEGKRRMDLIRQGKLISAAKARGVSAAEDYKTRFPIPLNEIDANPALEQNPGY